MSLWPPHARLRLCPDVAEGSTLPVNIDSPRQPRPPQHCCSRTHRLRGADVTVSSFGEIQIYNIRRLFANQGHELGDLRTEQSGQKNTTRRIRNATM